MYAIVAVDEKWGIGRDNGLLFRLPADLKRFRSLTEGHTVLMGRKTLESLPGGRGLPRRRNIVLTGQRDFAAENCQIVHSPAEAVLSAMRTHGSSAARACTGRSYPCAAGCTSPASPPTAARTRFSPTCPSTPNGGWTGAGRI